IEIQEKLINYLSEYPTPQTVQMDNGKEFDNNGIKNLLNSYKIEAYYITPGDHGEAQDYYTEPHYNFEYSVHDEHT
ncbi:hypothetical protein ACUWC2_28995, partial [Klebsiella pneumoniae]|uniref:hypothetical protein n=1 Tax=Klebsiella pneumoniae TaxID=573 RepID=UPI0040555148